MHMVAAAAAACRGFGPRSPGGGGGSSTTGLEWSGNESTTTERLLYWDDPFAIYDATYVFRIYPKGPKGGPNPRYWATFFWGNRGEFGWDGGGANTYYGAHPFPNPPPDGSSQPWEISVGSQDYLGPVPTWDRWYTQVFRAWRESSTLTHHEFIYDYDLWISSGKTQGFMSQDVNAADWADTNPPTPAIMVGQAPRLSPGVPASWGGYEGYEEFKGIIRGLQFYDAKLTDTQVANEMTTPGSARTPWYLNINPTPSDVTDKSGSGHHGSWAGSTAALWTE